MSADLERAAAACLFPPFEGLEAPRWALEWIERGLGGVVLFSRNISDGEQVAALTASLRRARADLLVATDEEGGDVTRLETARGSSYPGNLALGAVDDERLTEDVAAALGADLAAVGVDLDLAPVADVNTNPRNPVIGVRSFGSDPRLVARHVAAFVRGLQRQGVAACAKHFPGHGDTEVDSHLGLPTVSADRESLARDALPPFRAAIEAGVRAIMTAHTRVEALDRPPATLSRAILHDLLRVELGFDGLVVTDALEMRAIAGTVGMEEGAVQTLAAGADALCLGADVDGAQVERVHRAVIDAVRAGRLSEARVHEAAARVGETARWTGTVSGSPPRRGAGADAARRALRIEGTLALGPAPVVVELRPEASIAAGEALHGLGDLLRARVQEARVVRLTEHSDARTAFDGPLVLVVRDAHRHAWERRAVEALLAAAPGSVVVETGLPLWRPQGASAYVSTFGHGRANLDAAAEALAAAQRPASSAGATPSR